MAIDDALAPRGKQEVGRGPRRPQRDLTGVEREQLAAFGAAGLSQAMAAGRLGVAPNTFRAILDRDEEAARLGNLGRAEHGQKMVDLLGRYAEQGLKHNGSAGALDVTVYDALYLALARRRREVLVTADGPLVTVAGRHEELRSSVRPLGA